MRNRVTKRILLSGLLCVLGLMTCACRDTKEESGTGAQQEEAGDPALGDEPKEEDSEPAGSNGDEETPVGSNGDEEAPAGSNGDEEAPAGSNGDEETPVSGQWTDDDYDLEGDVRDLKDGQFTLVEAITEELDDGGTLMISSSGEDDAEFNKVSVTYDEDTLFAIQTIYDGGDISEMSEATVADLKSNQTVMVWGSSSESGWKATQICIVKVE